MDVIRCEFHRHSERNSESQVGFKLRVNKDVTDPHFSRSCVILIHIHSASIQPVKASGKHQEQSNPTL